MLTDESEIRIKAIRGDIFLPDLKLWLDPRKSKPNAYICLLYTSDAADE